MNKSRNKTFLLPIVLLMIGFTNVSLAAIKWTFAGANSWAAQASFGASGDPGPNVTVKSWYNATTGYLTPGYIKSWSGGLGVCGGTEICSTTTPPPPEHAMDNSPSGAVESLVLDFGASASIVLKAITLGWAYTDSDITVLAFRGQGDPNLSGSKKYQDLIAGGWALVSQAATKNITTTYNAAGSYSTPNTFNSGNIASRYWLIGAYNSLITGNGNGANDTTLDYVKLASVSGVRAVPEPSTWLLLAPGLLLLRPRRTSAP